MSCDPPPFMTRLLALWQEIADSLWFVPAMCTIAGGVLAVVLVRANDAILAGVDPETLWWVFGGSADGAQGVLTAISGSIITVTGAAAPEIFDVPAGTPEHQGH